MEMVWGHYLFVGVPEEELTWLENKMEQRYGDVGGSGGCRRDAYVGVAEEYRTWL